MNAAQIAAVASVITALALLVTALRSDRSVRAIRQDVSRVLSHVESLNPIVADVEIVVKPTTAELTVTTEAEVLAKEQRGYDQDAGHP